MTDQTRVAIGKDPQLPQVLVDLQSYFEFSFEMDELLRRLESASTADPSVGEHAAREEVRDEMWRGTARRETHHPLPVRCTLGMARPLGHRGQRL